MMWAEGASILLVARCLTGFTPSSSMTSSAITSRTLINFDTGSIFDQILYVSPAISRSYLSMHWKSVSTRISLFAKVTFWLLRSGPIQSLLCDSISLINSESWANHESKRKVFVGIPTTTLKANPCGGWISSTRSTPTTKRPIHSCFASTRKLSTKIKITRTKDYMFR